MSWTSIFRGLSVNRLKWKPKFVGADFCSCLHTLGPTLMALGVCVLLAPFKEEGAIHLMSAYPSRPSLPRVQVQCLGTSFLVASNTRGEVHFRPYGCSRRTPTKHSSWRTRSVSQNHFLELTGVPLQAGPRLRSPQHPPDDHRTRKTDKRFLGCLCSKTAAIKVGCPTGVCQGPRLVLELKARGQSAQHSNGDAFYRHPPYSSRTHVECCGLC